MCLFGSISRCVGGILLKIHTAHLSHRRYKWWEFGCGRPIIKGTLLGKQSIFSVVPTSALIRGTPLKIHTSHSPLMHYKQYKFGFDRPIIKNTLLGLQITLSAVFRLLESILLRVPNFPLPRTSYKRWDFGCDRPIIKCNMHVSILSNTVRSTKQTWYTTQTL